MLRLIRTVRGRSTQRKALPKPIAIVIRQPIFFHDGVGFEGIKDGKAIYIDSKGNEALSASSGHDGVSIVDAGPFYDGYAAIELQGVDMWAKAGYTGMNGTTAYGLIDKTGALVKDPTAKSTQWATLVDFVAALTTRAAEWLLRRIQFRACGVTSMRNRANGRSSRSSRKPSRLPMAWRMQKISRQTIGASSTIPAHGRLFLGLVANSDDQSLVAAGGLVYGTAEAVGGAAPVTSEGWMNAQGLWVASWKL